MRDRTQARHVPRLSWEGSMVLLPQVRMTTREGHPGADSGDRPSGPAMSYLRTEVAKVRGIMRQHHPSGLDRRVQAMEAQVLPDRQTKQQEEHHRGAHAGPVRCTWCYPSTRYGGAHSPILSWVRDKKKSQQKIEFLHLKAMTRSELITYHLSLCSPTNSAPTPSE